MPEVQYKVDLPAFTGRNVPIKEIAQAMGKDAQYELADAKLTHFAEQGAAAHAQHEGRIALNNGLNTLEPVTVQMAVSKADDGKWSIDDDSIVKFDQALMFYPESFE